MAASAPLALLSCGGGEQESSPNTQTTRRAPVDQPPPQPEPVSVANLTMHERVEFPQEHAPADRSLAQSIADFASALASGDAEAMQGLLDEAGAAVLEDLRQRDAWEAETDSIERVRIVSVNDSGGTAQIGLGVLDDEGAYLLGWEAAQIGGGWTFSGLAIEPQTALTLAELDGAPLTVRMLPVARAEDETVVPEAPVEETPTRSSGGGSRMGR